jgi:hypothetical protein
MDGDRAHKRGVVALTTVGNWIANTVSDYFSFLETFTRLRICIAFCRTPCYAALYYNFPPGNDFPPGNWTYHPEIGLGGCKSLVV